MTTNQVRRIVITGAQNRDDAGITLDIFEHRLRPNTGYTVEDMIDVLLGTILRHRHGVGMAFVHHLEQMSTRGMKHPVGQFERGFALCIENLADSDAEVVRIDGDTIHIPSGETLAIQGLFPPELAGGRTVGGAETFVADARKSCPVFDIALGAILASSPIPFGDEKAFENAQRIAVRCATFLDLGFPAGRAGRDKALCDLRVWVRNLTSEWWLLPDRMRHPTQWSATPELIASASTCDPNLIALGRRLLEHMPEGLETFPVDAVVIESQRGISNHQKLALMGDLKKLDRLIEDEAPIKLLKPAPRKRRDARSQQAQAQKQPIGGSMTDQTDASPFAGDGLPHDHPRVAYIGVDGNRYRVLVPIQEIWIKRVEGDFHDLGEWTFPSWNEAHFHLDAASKSAPENGAYDKHDFAITWADGATYGGRHDLTRAHQDERLRSQVRNFLTWMRDDEEHNTQAVREGAARMLKTHDLGQAPVPAPADWEVVHDYRKGNVDFAAIQARYFPKAGVKQSAHIA